MSERAVKEAIDLILCFDELLKRTVGAGASADQLATRMNNFLSLVSDAGIVPALAFYLSKIDSDRKRKLLNTLILSLSVVNECSPAELGEEDRKAFKADLGGEAYVTATALLLALLKRLGLVDRIGDEEIIRWAIKQLGKLNNNPLMVEAVSLDALTVLKELTNALYKQKK